MVGDILDDSGAFLMPCAASESELDREEASLGALGIAF